MNEIKIYLNPSGSTAEVYKDFSLYQESYRNTQITLYVPTELLYENADGTYLNAVKTGAILTAPNGAKVPTKSFNAEFVKTVEMNGVKYALYTQLIPKEFVLYVGTQIIVCNVLSIDNSNATSPQIISVTTSQVVPLTVLASAFLDNDEPLDPTEAEVIEGLISSLQTRLNDGEYATRALYAWSPDYTYGANELVSYPQKGQYGAIIKSLVADNKQNPYVNGEINSQYWAEIIEFNILNGLYGLRVQIEEALVQSQANANVAASSAATAESAMSYAQDSAAAAQEAAESIKASADYLESIKDGTVAVPKAVSDGAGANIADHFADIEELIPSMTTPENQLANEAFVNSSINAMAAFYITYNAGGDAFPTRASLLNATTYYYGGQARTPTQNDYAIVLADESQPKDVDGNYPTTRYSYQGGNWAFQYIVNNTSLTQAQVDAINSGITNTLVEQITTNKNDIATKASKDVATQTANGLMSAADKTKLDGLGVGNVTGVKGAAETTYHTGNVNLTPANIGAVNKTGDTMTGTLNVNGDVNAKSLNGIALELKYSTPFIDFHYNNSTSDYSVRLINDTDNQLTCKGKYSVEGKLTAKNGADLLQSGNEFNFATGYDGTNSEIVFNYRDVVTPIRHYKFCTGINDGNSLAGIRVNDLEARGVIYEQGARVYSPNNKPKYTRDLIGQYTATDDSYINVGSLEGYDFFEIEFIGQNSRKISTGLCYNSPGSADVYFSCFYTAVGGIRGRRMTNTMLHIQDVDAGTTFILYGIKLRG